MSVFKKEAKESSRKESGRVLGFLMLDSQDGQLWNKETLETNSMSKSSSIASYWNNYRNPYPGGMVRLGGEMDNAVRYLW